VDVLTLVLVFAVLLAAVALVASPLRGSARERAMSRDEAQREELAAAKEAKYREIRDAEMDFRTGKLSEPDYRALDRQLRGEAVEILRRLDELP
jgi:hypothetical protein